MTARRPSGGGGPGIEARAEAPRCAAKAWTAPNSTAQSRPSTASMPGRGAGAFATREAPIMDERACGKGKRLGVIMCVGVCVGLQRSLQRSAFITMLNLVTWAVPVKRHRGEPGLTHGTRGTGMSAGPEGWLACGEPSFTPSEHNHTCGELESRNLTKRFSQQTKPSAHETGSFRNY